MIKPDPKDTDDEPGLNHLPMIVIGNKYYHKWMMVDTGSPEFLIHEM